MTASALALAGGALLAIAGAVIAFFGWRARARLDARLAELLAATRAVAEDDLGVHVSTEGPPAVARLGEAFNEMTARLREARERVAYLEKAGAWQEIARRLAHEIKNPLTPIQMVVQELHTKYAGDDPAFRRLLDQSREIVAEEIGTLRRLVDEFAAFAKLPAAAPRRTDLNALVEDFLTAHKELTAQVDLRWQRAEPSAEVLVDTQLMRRVLYNLVENAVQALGDKPDARVTLQAAVNDRTGHAYIFVADNGPGIRPELRRNVFDSYFTTKAAGTGLGLAIVKKIVLEHRGSVAVSDAPEGGASFMITLPLTRPPAQG